MLLVPAGHYSSIAPGNITQENIQANAFSNSSLVFSNRTVIGNNLSRSVYRITGDLSVANNSTMKIINTVVVFSVAQSGISRLVVLGKLELYNSEITISSGSPLNASLNVTVTGNKLFRPVMLMINSSLIINGSLNVHDSIFTARNSDLNGTSNGYLGTDFQNSTVLLYNCTLSGERHHSMGEEYTSGVAYNSDPLYSNIGYIPLHDRILQNPDSHINRILVSVSYGGYTYGNASYILFNLSGYTVLKYVLSSTGYPFNETTVNFSIALTGPLSTISSIENEDMFTAYFSLVPYKTNTTVFNVSIGFSSNDTVSYYGKKFFGPVISNTTFYAVNTRFELNYDPSVIASGEYNPEKSAVFLQNGSMFYSIGSYSDSRSGEGNASPFEVNNSSLYIYSFQHISDTSSEGNLNGYYNSFASDNLNSSLNRYTNYWNNMADEVLEEYSIQFSNTSLHGLVEVPLLRVYINSTSSFYCGNYVDNVGGHRFYFSENSSMIYLNASEPLAFKLEIPDLEANMSHSTAVFGDSFNLNLTIISLYGSTTNLTLYVNATEGSSRTVLKTVDLNISDNGSIDLNWSYESFRTLDPGEYTLNVTFTDPGNVFNINRTLVQSDLTVYSNIDLGLNCNYSWVSSDTEVLLNTTISNIGSQYANNTTLTVKFYGTDGYMGEYSANLNITPHSNAVDAIYFAGGSVILNATLILQPPSSVHPYNSSGEIIQVEFAHPPSPGVSRYYYLNVSRTGIPEYTLWSFIVNETEYSTVQDHMVIRVASGNQTININGIKGYHLSQSVYNIEVESNISMTVRFMENNYTISFLAEGSLPSYGWAITIGGITYVPRGSVFNYSVPSGVYEYNVTGARGYSISNMSAAIGVTDRNITVVITFTELHPEGFAGTLSYWVKYLSPLIVSVTTVAGIYAYSYFRNSCEISLAKGHKTIETRSGRRESKLKWKKQMKR